MPAHVRVELRNIHPNSSRDERIIAHKRMYELFRKLVDDNGCVTKFKEKQEYETPSEKKRRKHREAIANSKRNRRFRGIG